MNESWLFQTESLERALAYRIHRLARVLSVMLGRTLGEAGAGISAEQFFLLFRIQADEGCSQASLADRYLNDAPNVTRMLDSLADRGFVERRLHPTDRRRRAIHLTPAGRELWQTLETHVIAERRALYAGIDEATAELLLSVLDTLEQNAIRIVRPGRDA